MYEKLKRKNVPYNFSLDYTANGAQQSTPIIATAVNAHVSRPSAKEFHFVSTVEQDYSSRRHRIIPQSIPRATPVRIKSDSGNNALRES